jgi:hypothetical protein
MIIPPAFKAGAKGIAERCGWIVKSWNVGRWNVSLKDDGSFPSDYHARNRIQITYRLAAVTA